MWSLHQGFTQWCIKMTQLRFERQSSVHKLIVNMQSERNHSRQFYKLCQPSYVSTPNLLPAIYCLLLTPHLFVCVLKRVCHIWVVKGTFQFYFKEIESLPAKRRRIVCQSDSLSKFVDTKISSTENLEWGAKCKMSQRENFQTLEKQKVFSVWRLSCVIFPDREIFSSIPETRHPPRVPEHHDLSQSKENDKKEETGFRTNFRFKSGIQRNILSVNSTTALPGIARKVRENWF